MSPPEAIPLLPEALVAGLAAAVLFYAWRGLARVPLLPRLLLGVVIGLIVPVSFGLVIMALSPYGQLPGERHARGGHAAAVAPEAARATKSEPRPEITEASPPPPVREAVAVPPPPSPPQVAAIEPPAVVLPPGDAAPDLHASSDARGSVTVLYGTDRVRARDGAAVRYTAGRANRLELGRAIVAGASPAWATAGPARTGLEATASTAAAAVKLAPLSNDAFAEHAARHLAGAKRFVGQALVLIHGYNTSLEAAAAEAAGIALGLGLDAPPFVYSWPSASAIASYTHDQTNAGAAASHLAEFLALVSASSEARDVSVVAFDMGAVTLVQALTQPPAGMRLREIILVAPDVDAQTLADRAPELARLAHVSVFATRRWRPLAVARRFHAGAYRAGDVPLEGPLVIPGLDTIDATAETTWSDGPTPRLGQGVLAQWAALIERGSDALARGSPQLRPVTTKSGQAYWQFVPATR